MGGTSSTEQCLQQVSCELNVNSLQCTTLWLGGLVRFRAREASCEDRTHQEFKTNAPESVDSA